MAQHTFDYIGRHFLQHVHGIVQEQLLHHFVELFIAEASHQNFLGVTIHISKGIGRKFL